MKEYEIQVLGSDKKRKVHRGYIWAVRIVGIILMGSIIYVLSLFILTPKSNFKEIEKLKDESYFIVEDNKKGDVRVLYDEGVHDVPLHIYQPVNMNAKLTMDENELPDSMDDKCFLAVVVLNISPQSNLSFQEFAIGGDNRAEKLQGYCAINDGGISVGLTNDDAVKEFSKKHGESYFRQIPLVIDGYIYINEKVRGKDYRRAIAKESGYVYIIESENKESLYDFSAAIRGLGISDAINLPVGYLQFQSSNDGKFTEGVKNGGVYLLFK